MQRTFCPWKLNRQTSGDSATIIMAIPTFNKGLIIASKPNNNGNNRNNVSTNAKFGAVSIRPQDWIGTWHNLEVFPSQLQGNNQITLLR